MSLLLYHLFLFLYKTGIRLVAPWNPKARLWLQGRRTFPELNFSGKTIWVHCSSLGEFEQGRPVLEAIRKQYPGFPIVLSFFSPSGYEIRKDYSGADRVIYLPLDSPRNAKKLVKALQPALVIWVKYEYWYYYLNELHKQQIPILLVSGIFRPSQPFFRFYGAIWRYMLSCYKQIFVQNQSSAELLAGIGFDRQVAVSGDTRFDRVIAIAEQQQDIPRIQSFIGNRPVLVAGSTWPEDEEELLHFVKKNPGIRFIIAPHEVDEERIEEISKTFHDIILYSNYSDEMRLPDQIHVMVIDNIGMLSKLYRYADISYIGGGFGNDGIHNVLEAAVYHCPVVFGPVYEKFMEARDLVSLGGAFSVENALELEEVLNHLFSKTDEKEKAGKAAGDYVYAQQGATQKIMDYIMENRLLTN